MTVARMRGAQEANVIQLLPQKNLMVLYHLLKIGIQKWSCLRFFVPLLVSLHEFLSYIYRIFGSTFITPIHLGSTAHYTILKASLITQMLEML